MWNWQQCVKRESAEIFYHNGVISISKINTEFWIYHFDTSIVYLERLCYVSCIIKYNFGLLEALFWPPSSYFLQNLISAIDFSSENNPLVEVLATLTNAFLLLKLTSSFQAAFQSASNSKQPNMLIFMGSESHELFKNAIKRLSFDWDGGQPVVQFWKHKIAVFAT